MLFHAGCVLLSISGRAALAAVAHMRSLTCPSSLSSSGPCRTRYEVPQGATSARCLSMASRLPSPAPVPRAPPRQHPPPRRSTTHPQPCLLRSQAPHQTHRRSDGQFRLPPSTASPYVLVRTISRARAWPSRLSRPSQRYLGAQLCPAMRSPKEKASTRPPRWPHEPNDRARGARSESTSPRSSAQTGPQATTRPAIWPLAFGATHSDCTVCWNGCNNVLAFWLGIDTKMVFLLGWNRCSHVRCWGLRNDAFQRRKTALSRGWHTLVYPGGM